MLEDALVWLAVVEATFLVGNLIAWRRNRAWAREMQQCNEHLATALQLASQGRYAEAETVAASWKTRMEFWQFGRNYWKLNRKGQLVYENWWRRWLGV